MRLIHLADLHLGFHAYGRLTRTGINQREADVALTFTRVIDLLIARRPELVIIAGDIFHSVKPGNAAILHAFTQFSRLTSACPEMCIIMVAGNHDTPRTAETGCILPLFREIGVHVADYTPQRFRFPEHDLSVLAVPDAMHARPEFTPDPRARLNVCVAHLEVAGLITGRGVEPQRTDLEVPLEALGVEQFQYVGVGHYHVFRQLAPNACYAGSIDYTSSNCWGEMQEERALGLRGKCVVECDLETGEQRRHDLPPSRQLIDLPAIDAAGMSPKDLDDAIQANANAANIDRALVRQVVNHVRRGFGRELDHQAIRQLKKRATHFHLVLRPEAPRTPELLAVSGTSRPSVADLLRGKLEERAQSGELDPAVAARLVATGTDYLERAAAMESEKRGEPTFTTAGETPADAAA